MADLGRSWFRITVTSEHVDPFVPPDIDDFFVDVASSPNYEVDVTDVETSLSVVVQNSPNMGVNVATGQYPDVEVDDDPYMVAVAQSPDLFVVEITP